MNKKSKQHYIELVAKIDSIESKISDIRNKLTNLKHNFMTSMDPNEEICPDEIAADQAALENIHDICLESLLDFENKGEA